MTKIILQDGKYTITHNNGADLKALRYGEEWRDLVGDGLIMALCNRIEELEADYDDLRYELRNREGMIND